MERVFINPITNKQWQLEVDGLTIRTWSDNQNMPERRESQGNPVRLRFPSQEQSCKCYDGTAAKRLCLSEARGCNRRSDLPQIHRKR